MHNLGLLALLASISTIQAAPTVEPIAVPLLKRQGGSASACTDPGCNNCPFTSLNSGTVGSWLAPPQTLLNYVSGPSTVYHPHFQ